MNVAEAQALAAKIKDLTHELNNAISDAHCEGFKIYIETNCKNSRPFTVSPTVDLSILD